MGSPTNHLGSRQRRDTGQGSTSPLTGGQILTNYQKLKKHGPTIGPVLLGRVSLARHNIIIIIDDFEYTQLHMDLAW